MISHESKFMITKFMTNIFTIITRSAAPYLLWLLPLQRSFLQNPLFPSLPKTTSWLSWSPHQGFQNITISRKLYFPFLSFVVPFGLFSPRL